MYRLLSALLIVTASSPAFAEEPSKQGSQEGDPLHPRYKMETSLGDIVLELDADKAPISVLNFQRYVESGFYNGTIFHRIKSDFMIQGGGFTSADQSEKKEGLRSAIKNEWKNGLKNDRGTISMARLGGNPDSATSQFFINVVDNARLDQAQPDGAGYCVFGKVVEGLDVVDKIKSVETGPNPKNPRDGNSLPKEAPVINSVKLISTLDQSKVETLVQEQEAAAKKAEEEARIARDKQIQEFAQNIEAETGKKFAKTGSGLMYIVLQEGAGEKQPQPTDKVKVHYTGWLLDGTKFDSSVDRGEPAELPLNQFIKGWAEGVGLMKVGEKRKLLIPSELAYGPAGKRPSIPPNAPLVFDVELLEIK